MQYQVFVLDIADNRRLEDSLYHISTTSTSAAEVRQDEQA